MADYIKFSVPEELKKKQAIILEKARKTGKIRIGG